MSYSTSSRSRNPRSSIMCSFARRPATAKTSPLIESESPDGIQASPIPIDDDDEHELPSFSTVTSSSNKRKRDASTFIISDDDEDKKTIVKFRKASSSKAKPAATTPKKKASKPKATASPNKTRIPSPEKRLRPYRNHAPQTYQARYERALTQRMFLIDRQRTTRSDEHGEYKEEVFDMAGTTGNVYQVTISKLPKCTCPDWRNNRSQCKHIIYVLVNVLKCPDYLQYQLAYLSKELEEIFENAPASPQSSDGSKEDTSNAGKRKPIEGDCPICMTQFEAGEDLLWCQAACGNNIHKACFEQWAKTKPGEVKCVYCRTPWKGDEETVKVIAKSGEKNEEVYVNVGSQLGLSGRRDTSTYYRPRIRLPRNWFDRSDYQDEEDDEDYEFDDH